MNVFFHISVYYLPSRVYAATGISVTWF